MWLTLLLKHMRVKRASLFLNCLLAHLHKFVNYIHLFQSCSVLLSVFLMSVAVIPITYWQLQLLSPLEESTWVIPTNQ